MKNILEAAHEEYERIQENESIRIKDNLKNLAIQCFGVAYSSQLRYFDDGLILPDSVWILRPAYEGRSFVLFHKDYLQNGRFSAEPIKTLADLGRFHINLVKTYGEK